MKGLRQRVNGQIDEIDVGMLLASEKMNVRLKKNFTRKESEFIMRVISQSSGERTVNWGLVEQFFESGCEKKEMMKKIRNHYYNQRSLPARLTTKRNDSRMVFLGLDI